MTNKALDLVVNHPPVGIISEHAQVVVAVGIAVFLFLWGLAKVCASIRRDK